MIPCSHQVANIQQATITRFIVYRYYLSVLISAKCHWTHFSLKFSKSFGQMVAILSIYNTCDHSMLSTRQPTKKLIGPMYALSLSQRIQIYTQMPKTPNGYECCVFSFRLLLDFPNTHFPSRGHMISLKQHPNYHYNTPDIDQIISQFPS